MSLQAPGARAGHGRLVALLALAAVAVAGAPACRGSRRNQPIATLVEESGVVEKEDASTWRAAAAGASFVIDDAVRTGPRSSARLRVTAGGLIRMGESSLVRFRQGSTPEQSAPEIVVDFGRADVEEAAGLSIVSAAGRARVERGARVRVSAAGGSATLEVIVGRAILTGRDGDVAVEAGQGITFHIGGVIVEKFKVKVGQAVLERVGNSGSPAAAPVVGSPEPPSRDVAVAADGAAAGAQSGRAPTAPAAPPPAPRRRADISLTAGDSAVLHDGKLPLSVRLRFEERCPGEAVVEMGRTRRPRERLSGTGAVVLRLRAGRHRYRLRCVGDAAEDAQPADGVLTVKRDSGNVSLARHAARNTIEADGRRYTILFQTRPPALTLVWPSAPSATADLELHIESAGRARTLNVRTPSNQLPAGSMAEGTHTWWYVTRDGRESPRTAVTIRFDNTAPTAQFFRAPSLEAPGGTIAIDGVTLQGAKVTAAGQPLDVDDNGRFHAAVAPLEGDDAVAVHIESPSGSSHYYIRRRTSTQ